MAKRFYVAAILLIGATGGIQLMNAIADASTMTSSMSVSATVSASCTVVTAPIAFGTYSGAQVDRTAALNVTCTDGTPYSVALGDGTGSGGAAQRQMTGPNSQTLNYSIYTDSSRSSVWGSASTGSTNVVTNVGNGSMQTVQAYGRVPGAQGPMPGVYQDTVVVTLTY